MGLLDSIAKSKEVLGAGMEIVKMGKDLLDNVVGSEQQPKKPSQQPPQQPPQQAGIVSTSTSQPADMQSKVVEAENGLRVPSCINSLDEMQSFLTNAEASAPPSIQSMLRVQMSVVKYIKSPTLVDSSIDTMIMALRESLEENEDEVQKKKIRKLFHRMLANYIFFIDARLKVEIEGNRTEGLALLSDAGDALAKTMVGVAAMAATGPIGAAAVSTMAVTNIFNSDPNRGSIFTSVIKWFNRKEEAVRIKKDFYESLMAIVRKLDKYSGSIGRSMLLSGAIERYAKAITEYVMGADVAAKQKELDTVQDAIYGRVSRESLLDSLKSIGNELITTSFISSPASLTPIDDFYAAQDELKEAEDEAKMHAQSFFNLHKKRDNERIQYCQQKINHAKDELQNMVAQFKQQLHEAKLEQKSYYDSIMAVAAKYDEL